MLAAFGEYDAAYYNAWHFDILSNKPRGEVYYSGGNRVGNGTANLTMSTSNWNWYVMTFDGDASGALSFYVDAVKDTGASNTNASATSCLNTTRDNLYIGRNENSAAEAGANGDIDELRIRRTLLSANWITTEYNNQSDEAGFWGTWSDVGGGVTFIPRVSFIM
jgi:hypothetical protein